MNAILSHSRAAGLVTLRPGTLDDLPAAVAMFNACSREASGKDEFDLADYR